MAALTGYPGQEELGRAHVPHTDNSQKKKITYVGSKSVGSDIWLMDRDIKVHQYVLEHRTASASDIARNFFNSQHSHAHYRRLRSYLKHGTMTAVKGETNDSRLYQLTPKGLTLLSAFGISTAGYRGVKGLYRTAMVHDNMLRQLSEIFQVSPLVSAYLIESKVKSMLAKKHGIQKKREERYKVPDALFTLEHRDRKLTIALELELAPKSKARYITMMRQLCTSDDFDNVFIVAKDESIMTQLRTYLSQVLNNDPKVRYHPKKHNFYFVLLPELLDKKLDARFESEDGSFTLRELEPKTILP